MKNYLSYKNELIGLQDVAETLKTVEKIAASSIHFLKNKSQALASYAEAIDSILGRLSLFMPQNYASQPLLCKKGNKKILLLLTGNKGLVGGLYHNLINAVPQKTYFKIIVAGKRGESYARETFPETSLVFLKIADDFQPQDASLISQVLFDEFKKEDISTIDILYPKFISLTRQTPQLVQFLPFDFKPSAQKTANPQNLPQDLGLPIIEPSSREIAENLIEKYALAAFYRIFAEAKLSELSARTVVTEHAHSKTEKNIRYACLDYFKNRRRLITQKQLESFVVHNLKNN